LITSAGVVLAATFTVLGVLPPVFLADNSASRSCAAASRWTPSSSGAVLVPALAYDIGPTIWWPSKLATTGQQLPRTGR
jgi:RND superfamily putative drug exporter